MQWCCRAPLKAIQAFRTSSRSRCAIHSQQSDIRSPLIARRSEHHRFAEFGYACYNKPGTNCGAGSCSWVPILVDTAYVFHSFQLLRYWPHRAGSCWISAGMKMDQ
jgi:hypothetical protein